MRKTFLIILAAVIVVARGSAVEDSWAHWKQHEPPDFCPDCYGELS